MLVTLSIHKLALIDELHLDFGPGLNVFTGETGAGKSILLDAIGLLLGNRGSVDLIRQDAETALVEATFRVTGEVRTVVSELFDGWGFDSVTEDVIVSRSLHRSGRTVCRINGRMASVQMLKDLGTLFVQQHGQHENLDLLKSDAQLALVDRFGGHHALLSDVHSAYHAWRELQRLLQEAEMDEQTRSRRIDMLRFQIHEIEAVQIRPGEEDELRAARTRLQNADRILQSVTTALEHIDGADDVFGATAALSEAAASLTSIRSLDDTLEDAGMLLETARIHAEEASRALSAYLTGLEADPDTLNQVEERLQALRTLERKYGPAIEDVMQYLTNIRSELQTLEDHEAVTMEREAAMKRALADALAVAQKLHQARVHSAAELSKKIEQILRNLSMPEAQLHIDVSARTADDSARQLQSTGIDDVSFAFSANRGADPKPLSKIASGGELSRTMLAVKSVMAASDGLETLIFDEIDAGVSGEAAGRVAEQLVSLAKHKQVLCVTHAPQIAAAATGHFAIVKQTDASTTRTQVASLSASGRIGEIARLVGADSADETARLHAKALMDGYQERLHVSG